MAFNIVAKLKVVPDDLSLQQLKNQIQAAAGGASGDVTIDVKLGPNTSRSLANLNKKLIELTTTINNIPTAVTNAVNSLNQLGKVKIDIGAKVSAKQPGGKASGGGGGKSGVKFYTVDDIRYANYPSFVYKPRPRPQKSEEGKNLKEIIDDALAEGDRNLKNENKARQRYLAKREKDARHGRLYEAYIKRDPVLGGPDNTPPKRGKMLPSYGNQKEIDKFAEDFTSGKKMKNSRMMAGSFTLREIFGEERFAELLKQRNDAIDKLITDADNKLTGKAQARRERRKVQDTTKLQGMHERFLAGESLSLGDMEFARRTTPIYHGADKFNEMFGSAQMVKPSRPGGRISYVNGNVFDAINHNKAEEALERLRKGRETQADIDLLTSDPQLQTLANQAMNEAKQLKMRKLASKWAKGGRVDTSEMQSFAAQNKSFGKYFSSKQKERVQYETGLNQQKLDKQNQNQALRMYKDGKNLDASQRKIITDLYGDSRTRAIVKDAYNQRRKSLATQNTNLKEAEKRRQQIINDAAIKGNIAENNSRLSKYDKAIETAEKLFSGGGVSSKNFGLMNKILKREGFTEDDINRMIGGGASNVTGLSGAGDKYFRKDVASGKFDKDADNVIQKILRSKNTPAELHAIRSNPVLQARLKDQMQKQIIDKISKALDNVSKGRRSNKDLEFIDKYKTMPQVPGGPIQADIDRAFADGEQVIKKRQDAKYQLNQQRSAARKAADKAAKDKKFVAELQEKIGRGEAVTASQFARAEKIQPGFGANLQVMPGGRQGAQARLMDSAKYKAPPSSTQRFLSHAGLAGLRFGAYAMATAPAFAAIGAGAKGMSESIGFEREIIKIAQTLGVSTNSVKSFGDSIMELSVMFGQQATELAKSARMFAQAGYSKEESKKLTELLAQTQLSASFDDVESTREGMIAVMQQFGKGARKENPVDAKNIGRVLDSINQVSADFAVESGDLVDAIRRAGSIFASSTPGNVGGVEATQELMAIFTAIRDTTRLQPEMISTAIVKVGSKLQTRETQDAIQSNLGISLRDQNNQFIGIYESLRLIANAMDKFEGTDPMFPLIAQELGGAHHIAKVIPLLQNFGKVEAAMTSAKYGQGSLDRNTKQAMEGFGQQLNQLSSQFVESFNKMFQDDSVQLFTRSMLSAAKYMVEFAGAAKIAAPVLAAIAASMAIRAVAGTQFGQNAKSAAMGLFSAVPAMPDGTYGPVTPAMMQQHRRMRIRGGVMTGLAAGAILADNMMPSDGNVAGSTLSSGISTGLQAGLVALAVGLPGLGSAAAGVTVGLIAAANAAIKYSKVMEDKADEEENKRINEILGDTNKDTADKMAAIQARIDLGNRAVQELEGSRFQASLWDNSDEQLNHPGFIGAFTAFYSRLKNIPNFIKGGTNLEDAEKAAKKRRELVAQQNQPLAKGLQADLDILNKKYAKGDITREEWESKTLAIGTLLYDIEQSTKSFSAYMKDIRRAGNIDKEFIKVGASMSKTLYALDRFSEALSKLNESFAGTSNMIAAIGGKASHDIGAKNKFDIKRVSPKLDSLVNDEKIMRDNIGGIIADILKDPNIKGQDEFEKKIQEEFDKKLPNSPLPKMLPKILGDIGFENIQNDIDSGKQGELVDKIMKPFENLKNLQDKFTDEYRKVLGEILKAYEMELQTRQEMTVREGNLTTKRRSLDELISGRPSSIERIDREEIQHLVPGANLRGGGDYVGLVNDEINRIQRDLIEAVAVRDGIGVDNNGNERKGLAINSEAYKVMTHTIGLLTSKLGNANLALDKLANSGEVLAEIQKRRAALEDVTGNWLMKSPGEQLKILSGLREAGNLLKEGKGLDGLGFKKIQGIRDSLMSSPKVPINIDGIQMPGEEAWSKLLRNTNPELNQLFGAEIGIRNREIRGGNQQQENDEKRAKGFGDGAGQIKAEADKKIQDELKKAGMENAKIFADSMKIFETQTNKFAESINKLSNAKIEMQGDFNLNVNMNGAQVFEKMQQGFKELVGVEIFKALNKLAQTKLKGLGNLNPNDIGVEIRAIEDNVGKN